jgi:hypothetical protein
MLLAHFWWESVFLINVPIAVAGIVAAIPVVPDSKSLLIKGYAAAGASWPGGLRSLPQRVMGG